MKFSSVTNEKLSDKVIGQIMNNIKSGKLQPGTRSAQRTGAGDELWRKPGNFAGGAYHPPGERNNLP